MVQHIFIILVVLFITVIFSLITGEKIKKLVLCKKKTQYLVLKYQMTVCGAKLHE